MSIHISVCAWVCVHMRMHTRDMHMHMYRYALVLVYAYACSYADADAYVYPDARSHRRLWALSLGCLDLGSSVFSTARRGSRNARFLDSSGSEAAVIHCFWKLEVKAPF